MNGKIVLSKSSTTTEKWLVAVGEKSNTSCYLIKFYHLFEVETWSLIAHCKVIAA